MERRIRSIVVGIAEIQDEDPHLAPAIRLAETLGATLHVVYAFQLPNPDLYPHLTAWGFDPAVLQQIQDDVQSRVEAQVRGIAPDDRIRCHAVPGPADASVLSVAEDVRADLIVVGATRRGAIARTVLGTTAQRIVRSAAVPVLVNRRPGHGAWRRVLLTTDLSELSARAHERGLDLVEMLDGAEEVELRTLLVVGYDFAPPPPLSRDALTEAAEAELGRFLRRAEPDVPALRGRVRAGDPAREIVAEATEWDADLLVVGTHGRTGVSRFLIGSVAEEAIRNTLCDVLVIPAAAVSLDEAEVADGGARP